VTNFTEERAKDVIAATMINRMTGDVNFIKRASGLFSPLIEIPMGSNPGVFLMYNTNW
jgi:hypothetical protein